MASGGTSKANKNKNPQTKNHNRTMFYLNTTEFCENKEMQWSQKGEYPDLW